ncbi:hypothetical protein [Pectobacterium polaris]|uniref:hypothetical protein n=1 Tax=Pectobacterium polaris TaxID=2042057 RepID=UPI001CF594DB|nr:hypothetical protein [Pectobacterium polaris]MCA6954673.1 hypothetical protein [Pectobacterium polaris]
MIVSYKNAKITGGDMGFYYVYQLKPQGVSLGKHLNVSNEFSDRDLCKKAKSIHKMNDPDCVFSEIIKASSPEEVLQKVQSEWLSRL